MLSQKLDQLLQQQRQQEAYYEDLYGFQSADLLRCLQVIWQSLRLLLPTLVLCEVGILDECMHLHLLKFDFILSGFQLILLFCKLFGPGFQVSCYLCLGNIKSFKLFLESKSIAIKLRRHFKIILLPDWRDRFFNINYVLCLLTKQECQAFLSESGFPLIQGLLEGIQSQFFPLVASHSFQKKLLLLVKCLFLCLQGSEGVFDEGCHLL